MYLHLVLHTFRRAALYVLNQRLACEGHAVTQASFCVCVRVIYILVARRHSHVRILSISTIFKALKWINKVGFYICTRAQQTHKHTHTHACSIYMQLLCSIRFYLFLFLLPFAKPHRFFFWIYFIYLFFSALLAAVCSLLLHCNFEIANLM